MTNTQAQKIAALLSERNQFVRRYEAEDVLANKANYGPTQTRRSRIIN